MSESVITQVRERLQERQKELQEELKQIEKAIKALARANGGPRKRSKPRGQSAEAVLKAVRSEPGRPAAQIAKELGINPGTTYGALNRLKEKGQVDKIGKTWFPAPVEQAEKPEDTYPLQAS